MSRRIVNCSRTEVSFLFPWPCKRPLGLNRARFVLAVSMPRQSAGANEAGQKRFRTIPLRVELARNGRGYGTAPLRPL